MSVCPEIKILRMLRYFLTLAFYMEYTRVTSKGSKLATCSIWKIAQIKMHFQFRLMIELTKLGRFSPNDLTKQFFWGHVLSGITQLHEGPCGRYCVMIWANIQDIPWCMVLIQNKDSVWIMTANELYVCHIGLGHNIITLLSPKIP